jgi:hypothetical protein
MREIDISNLKRYASGRYKGKIDWSNNVGEKLSFIYHDIKGEVEIIDYVKGIPQGTITVKYKDNVLPMKTNTLTKCSIGNLIKEFNYDYIYEIGDILETKHNTTLKILKQIEIFHTKYYERGYTVECLKCNHIYDTRELYIASCPTCSDRVSYPEKFVHSILRQLNVNFEIEKKFKWSNLKRYDIYIPDKDTIIEVHGAIHYIQSSLWTNRNKDTTKEENLQIRQKNDNKKRKLAILNNVSNYIIINARESNMNYIKQSVLSSDLNEYYNLSNINWLQCHEYACKSLVKQASDLWNENKSKEEISNILNLNVLTIYSYLKLGSELGYCVYNKQLNRKNRK